MNIKGGYKLIDLKKNDITVGSDAVTVAGTYDSIEHNYSKPTILTGLVIGGVEHKDTIVNFEHGENSYTGLFGMPANNKMWYITVTNEDAITIAEYEITLA